MQAAKNRALSQIDRQWRFERKVGEITRSIEDRQERAAEEIERAVDDDVGDDLLRLLFAACIRRSPPKHVSRSRSACSEV